MARSPALAAAKAAYPEPPRRLAVAPVNRIVPLSAGQHVARGFAASHETSEAGELPDTLEQRAGGFERARLGVGAGVEQAYLERADIALDGFEQRDDSALVAGVGAERLRPTASCDDGINVPCGLFPGNDGSGRRCSRPWRSGALRQRRWRLRRRRSR